MVKLVSNSDGMTTRFKTMEAKNQRTSKTPRVKKKPPEKVFRSIEEIRGHFFPNFYEKEERRRQIAETTRPDIVDEVLKRIQREIRESARRKL